MQITDLLTSLIRICICILFTKTKFIFDLFTSRMLFIIVAVFLICSLPRTILNLVELEQMLVWYFSKDSHPDLSIRSSECFDPPVWASVLSNVSSFLMTCNSSIGFVIYCMTCKQFRSQLGRRLHG